MPYQACGLDKKSDKLKLVGFFGGEGGIRTHAGLPPNGFQDRLVMTTSILLLIRLLKKNTIVFPRCQHFNTEFLDFRKNILLFNGCAVIMYLYDKEAEIMAILQEISELLQKGSAKKVAGLVEQALADGIPAQEILDNALLAGMDIIGEKFKNNEVYVPEVLLSARAMNMGAEVLKPHLGAEATTDKGTVILGTVKGDKHDIGKNLVRMMMEGKGLKVVDLGVDVDAAKFIEAAKENGAKVIACSALLTTTMGEMKNVVDLVKAEGLDAAVMVGGAPVTQDFSDSIGAHCYTNDAASCAEKALAFCQA